MTKPLHRPLPYHAIPTIPHATCRVPFATRCQCQTIREKIKSLLLLHDYGVPSRLCARVRACVALSLAFGASVCFTLLYLSAKKEDKTALSRQGRSELALSETIRWWTGWVLQLHHIRGLLCRMPLLGTGPGPGGRPIHHWARSRRAPGGRLHPRSRMLDTWHAHCC